MKTLFSLIVFLLLFVQMNISAQVTVSGAHAASNGTYATLKLGFDAINGQSQTGNNIVITITANTTESASALLNAGTWTTLKIYPTSSGLSISGSFTGALIDLNGADSVTIDGRVNQTGSKDLIIQHTSNASNANSTISYRNSAENNTIKYCVIKGCCPGTTTGVIFFSTATSGNGNDNNVINNCDITNGGTRPTNCIYSSGTASRDNSGNTISNNNFFNHHRTDATSSYGINLSSYSSNFTISGNSFYETTPLIPTIGLSVYPISVTNSTGDGYVNITGNYIGGQSAQCGGSAFTINTTTQSAFYSAINFNSTGSTTLSNITNNTIKNIDITTAGVNVSFLIYASGNAFTNVTGNVIGDSTVTGSIKLKSASTSAATSFGLYLIFSSTIPKTHYISNNVISGITLEKNANVQGHHFYGIYTTSGNASSTVYIENNLIGSTSTANSIHSNTVITGSTAAQYMYYISSNAIGATYIRNNRIANNTNAGNASTFTTRTNAIYVVGAGSKEVSNNTIRDIKDGTSSVGSVGGNASFAGILLDGVGTTLNIFGNTIYNLENTYTASAGVYIKGILFLGPTVAGTSNIYNNFVHSLKINSGNTSTSTYIEGIEIDNTSTKGDSTTIIRNVYNNIISLGNGVNNDCKFYGIFERNTVARTNNIYFNTVYIAGSPNGNNNTMALYISGLNSANVRDIRNNIFVNARSRTGGTGKHYSAYFGNITGLTLNYNDYYTPGTGGTLGFDNSSDKISLPIVTSQDANSKNLNPTFVFTLIDAGGTTPDEYRSTNTALRNAGAAGTGITKDFSGYTRPDPPSIGGIENDNPLPVNLSSFNSNVNGRNVKLNWVAASELNNSGFNVERIQSSEYGIRNWEKIGYVQGNETKNTPTNYSFEDRNLQTGKYKYRLKQFDVNGNIEYFALNSEVEIGIPKNFNLSQNYPNPFNPTTKINFDLPENGKVDLKVFDLIGREVVTLVNDVRTAGYYTVNFDGSKLSSGIYFYRIIVKSGNKDFVKTNKMMILK